MFGLLRTVDRSQTWDESSHNVYLQPPVFRLASEILMMFRYVQSHVSVSLKIGHPSRDGTDDLTLCRILFHQLVRLNNLFPRKHFLDEDLQRTILELREISTFKSQQRRPRHANSRDFPEHTLPTCLSASPDILHPDFSSCSPRISTSSSRMH